MRLAIARSIALVVATVAVSANAQVNLLDPGPAAEPPANTVPQEYRGTIGRLTPREIIQQKAQAKAAQRQNRIAAREWYGYSQARPKTNAAPFTGLYGPRIQAGPLGRPAALYSRRSAVVSAR